MSEENINGNEETSALFVSTQKKKQAEEEARRKAEEEQARREAAEAEVRRMEQEVEERRKEIEEKKKAAEKAADQAKQEKKEKTKTAAKTGGKKAAKIVGIGVAAIVVLFIVIGVAGSKKGPDIDYSQVVFDKEYLPQKEGYDVTIRYPGSLYSGATEEVDNKTLRLVFQPVEEGIPRMSVMLVPTECDLPSFQLEAGSFIDALNGIYSEYRDMGSINEEELCDLSDADEKKYEISCEATIAQDGVEAGFCGRGWYELNRIEDVMCVYVNFLGTKESVDDLKTLSNVFFNENATDAVLKPGNYPLEEINYDEEITFEELGLKIPLPKNRFKPLGGIQTVLGDKNGAIIVLDCNGNLDTDAIQNGDEEYLAELKDYYLEQAKEGFPDFDGMQYKWIDSRTFVTDTEGYADWQKFAEFTTEGDGVKYWERDFFSLIWNGDVAGNFCLVTYVPENSKDMYKNMLDEALRNIKQY